ncbi:peptidylprolyl isomerase [Ketobacter sp.]|uniref:FKBP-type peptidyl-prolyl cis-trans isomerase n=1 Tax=Ketobacter sp. TaxID=2083498 RepID=UPI000F0E17EF|nr:peptidylprolyl isomerase [Ketobacter sp.]RLU01297.1 MAG: peptidylprolyl isomerase [Ketobacter sp.]
MSDRIQNNKLVALHIRILDESGELLETTEGFLPMLYVHGHRQMPPGFEQALAGKTTGDKIDVQVPAEFGYGLRDEDLLQTVPRSLLATDTELAIGMEITAETADGPLPVRIVELNEHSITLDGNHVYAGKTLRFVAEIRNVRDATAEELTGGPQA